MTERGMVMSSQSVRASEKLLKTATRRVLNPQPKVILVDGIQTLELYGRDLKPVLRLPLPLSDEAQQAAVKALCVYQAGQRVYIKQRWRVFRALNSTEFEKSKHFQLMLDYGSLLSTDMWKECDRETFMKYAHDGSWKNPRFMPKWAARLKLDLVSIRLERLGDMSVEDCYAEGVRSSYGEQVQAMGAAMLAGRENHLWDNKPTKENFRWFWDQINGTKHPYDDDLWVWAIKFKPVLIW